MELSLFISFDLVGPLHFPNIARDRQRFRLVHVFLRGHDAKFPVMRGHDIDGTEIRTLSEAVKLGVATFRI